VPIGGNELGAKSFCQRQRTTVRQRYFAVHGFEAPDPTPKLRIHVGALLDAKSHQVGDGRFCRILIRGPPEIVVDLAFLRINSALLVGTNLYFPRTCRGAPAGLVLGARRGPTLLSGIKDLRTSPTISLAWSKDTVGTCA
jgi:hypothetical protein